GSDLVSGFWGKVDAHKIGGEALARLLVVYPWTQRYFTTFGNLGSADAICHNAKVLAHGEKVLAAIGEGLKHPENLKAHYAKLSEYHSNKLHVDPANFRLLGNVFITVLARHFQHEFTPELQHALEAHFCAVGDALAKAYH
uniref:Hemoglobin subunit beta n=1 Tax=Pelophylax lessonae TaxID=45623 RepID=HBB_PELLE|nr:RecName: Full=Hemoglobin subunit beta; AltName: Full=Beta-globin; AltName: Full=Hemoglobin beta chain [Pelophylax lessonae]